MPNFMTQIAEFLSERARGLLLTIATTGIGKVTGVIESATSEGMTILEKLQLWSYIGALTVALLTTISYGYKFYLFCKDKQIIKKMKK